MAGPPLERPLTLRWDERRLWVELGRLHGTQTNDSERQAQCRGCTPMFIIAKTALRAAVLPPARHEQPLSARATAGRGERPWPSDKPARRDE